MRTVRPSSAISSMRPSTARGRLGIEAGGRLVEQQEIGLVEHGAGEREPGPHAGGVAADLLVERVEDAEPSGSLGDAGLAHRGIDLEEVGGVAEVVLAGEAVVERGRAGTTPQRRRTSLPAASVPGSIPSVCTVPP